MQQQEKWMWVWMRWETEGGETEQKEEHGEDKSAQAGETAVKGREGGRGIAAQE